MKHRFAIIASVGKNNELGQANDLVWRNKTDLARFKKRTLGNAIIMGRKTFQSLDCAPLQKRMNIVLTSKLYPPNMPGGLWMVTNMEEACERAKRYAEFHLSSTSFFIGGAEIYKQAFELVDVLYMTEIDKAFPGADTFFPEYKNSTWRETQRENNDGFDFVKYERQGV